MNTKRDLLVLFALAGWALAVPHYGSEFAVSMALSCLMYAALSSSWSLFCGSTRYLSLATSIACRDGSGRTSSRSPSRFATAGDVTVSRGSPSVSACP